MLGSGGDGDGGDAAAEPAEGVHDADGGGAAFRGDVVVEGGPDVGVVEAFAEAEADHGEDEDGYVDGPAGEEEEGDAAEEAEGLGEGAAAELFFCEAIGEPAAEEDAEDGGDLEESGGGEACHGEGELEGAEEVGGHPGEEDKGDEVGADEGEDEDEHHGVGEDFAQGDGGGGLFLGGFRFAEEFPEADAEQGAGDTEGVEAGTPAVVLTEVTGEGAAGDGTGVDAGLVEGHGAGAGVRAVESADEGHGGGEIEGFAEAFEAAEDNEVFVLGGEGGGYGDEGPGDEAAKDDGFAGEAVADPAGEGAGGGVYPGKCAANDAKLDIREVKFAAEEGKDRENGLAVGIVKEADEPEHGDEPPFVGGVLHRFVDCRTCNDISLAGGAGFCAN